MLSWITAATDTDVVLPLAPSIKIGPAVAEELEAPPQPVRTSAAADART